MKAPSTSADLLGTANDSGFSIRRAIKRKKVSRSVSLFNGPGLMKGSRLLMASITSGPGASLLEDIFSAMRVKRSTALPVTAASAVLNRVQK